MKKLTSLLILSLIVIFNCIPAFCEVKPEENNYLKIELTQKKLHSRLAEQFDGHEYCVTNKYNEPVSIEKITLWDDANAKVAYLTVKKDGKEVAKETMNTGIKWALPTLSLSVIASAVTVPFKVWSNKIGNEQAEKEANKIGKKDLKQITLKPKEQLNFTTLTIKKHSPILILTFKNPITEENMEMHLK